MKLFSFLLVFIIGTILGWQGHSKINSFSAQEEIEPVEKLAIKERNDNVSDLKQNTFQFLTNKSLLNHTQLGVVIELIKQNLDVESQNQLNNEVIKYANSLVRSTEDNLNIEQHLIALIGNEDTKETVLELLVEFYARQKEYKKAVNTLYELRSLKNFDEDYQEVSNRIIVLTQKNIKKLSAYGFKSELTSFFEFILAKEPDNFDVQFQYAEFEYANRKYSRVEQLLGMLLHHPDFENQSAALMQKAQHQKDLLNNGVVPVPIEKAGDNFLVDALINNQEPVKLIIDTGASLTVLSSKIIRDLGLNLGDLLYYTEFSTANGIVKAPVFELDSISVRNHIVKGLKVGVLPGLSQPSISGLLGMNFLSQFTFFLDQKNSTLELVDIE